MENNLVKLNSFGRSIILTEFNTLQKYGILENDICELGRFKTIKQMDRGEIIGNFKIKTKSGRIFNALGGTKDYDEVVRAILKTKYHR